MLGLQEFVIVAMADGYAQAGRRPVFVNLHPAGGVGQVFTAYRNRTPMIVLAGQQVRSLLPGEPFLGATDATVFPQPYVRWACEPARAEDVPAVLAHACHVSTQHPQGPTFLSVPADDWDATASSLPVRPRIPGLTPDPAAVDELATALDSSRRPGIVAGPAIDADGAVDDLVRLAERLEPGCGRARCRRAAPLPRTIPCSSGSSTPNDARSPHQ